MVRAFSRITSESLDSLLQVHETYLAEIFHAPGLNATDRWRQGFASSLMALHLARAHYVTPKPNVSSCIQATLLEFEQWLLSYSTEVPDWFDLQLNVSDQTIEAESIGIEIAYLALGIPTLFGMLERPVGNEDVLVANDIGRLIYEGERTARKQQFGVA